MTSLTQWHDLPQALRYQVGEKPSFVDGKLLYKQFIARDPLSNIAYFDAVDLSHNLEPQKALEKRRIDRHQQGAHFLVNIHADLLKVKSLAAVGSLVPQQKSGGGLRGIISGFSSQSRMRLLQFMASIRSEEHMVFLTLTYPDEFPVDDVDAWLANFEAFRHRFERRFPNYRVIWRKEMKTRLSGENKGKKAPHYHMLIFTDMQKEVDIKTEYVQNRGLMIEKTVSAISAIIERWALSAWDEIVDSGDENHAIHGAFAVACRNRRHAYKYLSKYIAKVEQDDLAVGRRWGRIGTFDIEPSLTCVISKKEFTELLRMARAWMRSKGNQYNKKLHGTARGKSIFGLGDNLLASTVPKSPYSTVFRMLAQAATLNNILSPVPEVNLKLQAIRKVSS